MIESYAGMWTWGVILWTAIAFALAIGLILLVQWMRRRNIESKWYDWLIGAAGIALLLFTFQNFYACFLESEAQASWMFALLTGIPSLVLLGIPAIQIWRRNRTA